jgi:hypothetical protein
VEIYDRENGRVIASSDGGAQEGWAVLLRPGSEAGVDSAGKEVSRFLEDQIVAKRHGWVVAPNALRKSGEPLQNLAQQVLATGAAVHGEAVAVAGAVGGPPGFGRIQGAVMLSAASRRKRPQFKARHQKRSAPLALGGRMPSAW